MPVRCIRQLVTGPNRKQGLRPSARPQTVSAPTRADFSVGKLHSDGRPRLTVSPGEQRATNSPVSIDVSCRLGAPHSSGQSSRPHVGSVSSTATMVRLTRIPERVFPCGCSSPACLPLRVLLYQHWKRRWCWSAAWKQRAHQLPRGGQPSCWHDERLRDLWRNLALVEPVQLPGRPRIHREHAASGKCRVVHAASRHHQHLANLSADDANCSAPPKMAASYPKERCPSANAP